VPNVRRHSDLEVHHQKFRCQAGNDSEQNLVAVCAACHAKCIMVDRSGERAAASDRLETDIFPSEPTSDTGEEMGCHAANPSNAVELGTLQKKVVSIAGRRRIIVLVGNDTVKRRALQDLVGRSILAIREVKQSKN
jgi:hypothetical protein